jgi:hypothetical protein
VVCGYVMIDIETPHTLHTHVRSSSYVYNAIQHLLLWLVVISKDATTISALAR